MFPMFAASCLLLFTDFRFGKGDLWLLLFAAYSIGHSLVMAAVYGDPASSLEHAATLLFGLAMYRVALYIARRCREDPALLGQIAACLLIGFVPPLLAGFLQLLDAYAVRSGFSGALTGLFSEKVYRGRIQMLSGEPSWAAIHLLSGGLLMLWLFRQGYRRLLIPLAGVGVLTVLSFSAYGYTVLLTALLIAALMAGRHRVRMMLLLAVGVFVVAVGVPFLLETLRVSGYFIDRFQFDFRHLYRTDDSFFIRVVFPAIGFLEFAQHPLFGVGGGFYHRSFADLLIRHFSEGLRFREVYDLVFLMPERATSRNLLSRVFAEEGLIGVSLFLGFLASVIRNAGAGTFARFAFALALALVMNFDSYAFVNFWLLIGFVQGGFFAGQQPDIRAAEADARGKKGMKRIA